MLRFIRREIRYRIKKRTFAVLAIALTVTMAVAAALALAAVWLVGPANVLRIDITESDRRDQILGAGVDCAVAPSGNLLVDASFEPVAIRETLTVYEGDSRTMTIAGDQLAPEYLIDGYFDGASARVLSAGSNGLSLKKVANVAVFGVNRIGQFQTLQLPADLPAALQILQFTDRGEDALAVGEQGLILKGLAGAQPTIVPSGLTNDLTGICTSSTGFLACSNQGELIFSPDGSNWSAWTVLQPKPLNSVAVSDSGIYIAVGNAGVILAGPHDQMTEVFSPVTSDLIDVVYGQGTFLALAADGSVLRSSTGTIWEVVFRNSGHQPIWRALDYRDGLFALAGDQGLVSTSSDGRNFSATPEQASRSIRDLILMSPQQMIVLGDDHQFQYTNNGGQTWDVSSIDTGLVSERIALLGDHHIVSTGFSGQIGLAPLVVEIELDQPLVSGNFDAGDLLYLEKSVEDVPALGSWDVLGEFSAERTPLSSPDEGGQSSMYLKAGQSTALDTPAILSQRIDPNRFSWGSGSDIYTVELWMRQAAINDQSVRIWLSGNFKSIGTTIDHVGSTWKKYAHTFVLPSATIRQSSEVRLNISFNGPGELWLDRVFLGPAAQEPHGIDLSLVEEIRTIQPNVLRLSFLPLGQSTLASQQWANPSGNDAPVYRDGQWTYPAGQSLAVALQLAREGSADPWLVIDSSMGEAELLNLIEYLSGPISTTYGLLRMNQGQILPWTELFNHIYLEIRDTEQRFTADFRRADYVDWLISTVSQSPYFNALKNQLVFVDGMTYSDGVWRSSADYHTSTMTGLYQGNGQDSIDAAILAYYDQMPRNPSQSRQGGWYELVSPVYLESAEDLLPTLADNLSLQLQELGTSAGLVNLAISAPIDPAFRPLDSVAASIAARTNNSQVLDTIMAKSDLKAYAFRSGEREFIVVANCGQQPQTVLITGVIDTKAMQMTSYDHTGEILRERLLRSSREQLTVLPGGAVILEKPLDTLK